MMFESEKKDFYHVGRFLLTFLRTNTTFFKVDFFNGISIFDTVFFHLGVFKGGENDFEHDLGWFSFKTFEFGIPMAIPTYRG